MIWAGKLTVGINWDKRSESGCELLVGIQAVTGELGSIPTAPTKSPDDSIGLVHRIPEKRSVKAQLWIEIGLHALYCFKATRTNVEVAKPPALR